MKNIDINQVSHLYYHEKKSVYAIAEIFGCTPTVIYGHMQKNGLQRRSYSEAHRMRYSQKLITINLAEIVRLYFEEQLTLIEVGEQLGICSDLVRKRLIAAGYERRKAGESRHPRKSRGSKFTDADLAEMERRYCQAEESSAEIAYRYDCCEMTVRAHLRQLGVRLRTPQEAQALRRKKEKQVSRREDRDRTTSCAVRGTVGETRLEPVLPPEQVTPSENRETSVCESRTEGNGSAHRQRNEQNPRFSVERILQLRNEENLTIDAIAGRCSLSNLEVYNILQENA